MRMGVDHEFTVNGLPESQVYKVLGFPLQYGKERPLSLARALSRGPPPSHETLSTTGAQSCSYFWHTESWPLDRVQGRCAYDVTSKQEPELAGATTGKQQPVPPPRQRHGSQPFQRPVRRGKIQRAAAAQW